MKKRSLGKALRVAALAGVALLGACVGDGDEVITSLPPAGAGGELFARYVSMGNSLTAGFQSGGFNDSLQMRAYPSLLAQRAASPSFNYPAVAKPGCPVPFSAPLTTNTTPTTCFRINSPRIVNNVAVPGARIADLVRFPSGQTASLNTLLIGPQTQARAMIEADPTFVSVWAGNNDILQAVYSGLLGPQPGGSADSTLTPLASFQASLALLVDSIKFANPQGVMLVGVVDAVRYAPIVQPGAYFWLARDVATNRFQGKLVNANCSPITNLGQPNPLSANMVSFFAVTGGVPEINCDPSQYGGAFVLDPAERTVLAQRLAAYNTAIQQAATANNWLYVNPNEVFEPFLTTPNTAGQFQNLRKCQLLASATTPLAFQTAVVNSCPHPSAPNLFGALVSFDAIHPSTAGQVEFAKAFAQRINTKYGTTLPTS